MGLVRSFILRQRTRPSMEEGACILAEHLILHFPELLIEALPGGGEAVTALASLMVDGDVRAMMDAFIRSEDGGKFLDSPNLYEVKYIDTMTGDPPESTCIALVLDRESNAAELTQSLGEKLARARKWERLGRFGDAMLSYRVSLDAHKDDPDMLYGLACVQKKYWPLLPSAVEALKKCREARPDRAEYALELAECYQGVLEHETIRIVGASPADIREKIVDLLTIAARLRPDDPAILRRLRDARAGLASGGEEGFFK